MEPGEKRGLAIGQLQGVSTAPDGVDESAVMASIDFVPEIIDIDVDDVREGVKIKVPHVLGNHRAREHASRVSHHVFQQRVFLRGQVDPLPAARDFMAGGVQDEIVDLQNTRRVAGSSTQQGPCPGDQFFNGKGFGEIVVRAGIQPFHALVHSRASGQNEDRGGHLGVSYGFQDVDAGQAGQHEIEDDQVIVDFRGQVSTLNAVGAYVHRVTFFFQRAANERGDFGFVFDDQDTHGEIIIAWKAKRTGMMQMTVQCLSFAGAG